MGTLAKPFRYLRVQPRQKTDVLMNRRDSHVIGWLNMLQGRKKGLKARLWNGWVTTSEGESYTSQFQELILTLRN